MTDLLGALFGLIGSLIELCVHLVFTIMESLGYAVEHLASKPTEGERRFSAQRLLVAFAPFLFIISIIAGVWFYVDWSGKVRIAQVRQTRQLIEAQVEQLLKSVDDKGHLIPAAKPPDVKDAWGNPLRVSYEQSLLVQTVTVVSDGPDERKGSADDLSSARQILRPKKEIALDSLEKAKELVRDRLRKREAEPE